MNTEAGIPGNRYKDNEKKNKFPNYSPLFVEMGKCR